ncbi:bifunctional folylpolyglutamate synthase/dihydrofolate synthase [Haoranjiania flava]|uniref:Dihydrofolate synthase/folylpolyglutamate synthase n=1 Tax=Haoranjiania flava TaxID=1856322 RepID=A0AAE3IKE4_9BACT|nr:folylpolyglutamate synthase/dihydrofolate synthase family protein [Haoranjiania flava]MCU7693289.1 bifunctional folylpolyglutamate synthase/dihydrofolate synthase [Haoranjiania flava]
MNYAETIDYLYAQLPMFSKVGKSALKNNLSNTLELCALLGDPQRNFKTIHIAGTNGKGSVSHMLAAILQEAGYTVGLYTSPHLKDFRERIRVNGAICEEQFVIDFTRKMQQHIPQVEPSFFEITVAMAFDYFAQKKVDIAVIETGLGGRFDSTNIISPELSVITNIALDHVNILGNTLEKIATSKAGIIKPYTPVVIGAVLPETRAVFEFEAKEKNAPVIYAQQKYTIAGRRQYLHFLEVDVEDQQQAKQTYRLDLTGLYQSKNLLTVLAAADELKKKGFVVEEAALHRGLANTKKLTGLFGRWELIQEKPLIIADVGHNEDGIRQITENLQNVNYKQLHIVVGFVKDKDVNAALSLLPKEAVYYFTKANLPRAMQEDDLRQLAQTHGLQGSAYASVSNALNAAKHHATPDDMILICGSVFVVAEVSGVHSVTSVTDH